MFDLAIYYRMVGGFIGTGSTTLGRLRWAVTMAFYMMLVSLVHHEGWAQALIVLVTCTFTTFLGRLIGHSRFQASASLGNSLGMGVVNLLRVMLIVAPYSVGNWTHLSDFHQERLALGLFGLLSGAAYYVGNKWLNGKDSGIYFRNTPKQWRINPQTDIATIPNPSNILDQAAVDGSEWGELLTGLLCYQAMFVCALVMP